MYVYIYIYIQREREREREKEREREINNNTRIVGNVNIPLTPMDRSTKQKIIKETQTLNDAMDHLDLISISIGHFIPKQ